MSFRLYYQRHDLELSPGEFLIGRSVECQLSLDDPLVSRRHALLVVAEDSVVVRDLESRNGVLVNGTRVQHERVLADGDTITIGTQELKVARRRDAAVESKPGRAQGRAQTLTWMPVQGELADALSAVPTEASKRTDSLPLLSVLADKALALGKLDEAERILSSVLAEVLDASERGIPLPAQSIEQAGRYATKLAGATGKGSWADYVVRLYMAIERPLPAGLIEELHAVLRKVNSFDLTKFRAYLGRLRELAGQFGPAERFLLQRIEGLERLASLR